MNKGNFMNVSNSDIARACSAPVPENMWHPSPSRGLISEEKYSEVRDKICSFEGSTDISLTSQSEYEKALNREKMNLLTELYSAGKSADAYKISQLSKEALFRLKGIEAEFTSNDRKFIADSDAMIAKVQAPVCRRPRLTEIGMASTDHKQAQATTRSPTPG